MKNIKIQHIPAIIWGKESQKIYVYVHGKGGSKDGKLATLIANVITTLGFQVISFDLPEHGNRKDQRRCDVFDGVKDLEIILDYALDNYAQVNVIGCSIGAFFTLYAAKKRNINRCLFLSPVVNMEYLISQMFLWFDVTENLLKEKKEIATPVDPLRYDYYEYVKNHPILFWDIPTCILYGKKDHLQSLEIMQSFCQQFDCDLEISEHSEHAFMSEEDDKIIENWLITKTS